MSYFDYLTSPDNIRHFRSEDGAYDYDYTWVYVDHYRDRHPSGELSCGTCWRSEDVCDACNEVWKLYLTDDRHGRPQVYAWRKYFSVSEVTEAVRRLVEEGDESVL